MASANFNEEIIELTEVVEEGPGVKKRTITPSPPAPKRTYRSEDDFQSIPDSPLKKFILAEKEEDPTPQLKREVPKSPPPPPEPPRMSPGPSEKDPRLLEQSAAAQVEKWMNREGAQLIERLIRKMFPPIAEEVLRKEIEKLKAEAEEKL
jgi:hypothetical protein